MNIKPRSVGTLYEAAVSGHRIFQWIMTDVLEYKYKVIYPYVITVYGIVDVLLDLVMEEQISCHMCLIMKLLSKR